MGSEEKFHNILSQFGTSVNNASAVINSCLTDIDYGGLSTEDKIRYDLFLAYAMNSLLWVHLRIKGEDPMQTVLKTELGRVKELMAELQRIIDRKTIMPRIDQGAAKRFVKHGLWDPNHREENPKHKRFPE